MNEDFVSFDLAKKLKEKGFREKCLAFYTSTKSFYYNNTNVCSDVEDLLECCNGSEEYDDIDAPTISQILKWLRNEKDIFIGLEYINQEACGCTIIMQKTGGLIAKWDWDKFQYANKNPLVGNTYEEAAIAGIEYVLDNLI